MTTLIANVNHTPCVKIWRYDLESKYWNPLIVLFIGDNSGIILSGSLHRVGRVEQNLISKDNDVWANFEGSVKFSVNKRKRKL